MVFNLINRVFYQWIPAFIARKSAETDLGLPARMFIIRNGAAKIGD
jgi:hypothetical protein